MLQLTFRQTRSELMVRAAATILFETLVRRGAALGVLSDLVERPQYGYTASAATEPIGPKFVRITDLQDGRINWDSVPFCKCADPEKFLLCDDDLLFARTGATTGKTYLVQDPAEAVFASYLIRLRPKLGVVSGYLHAFFQSENYWAQISNQKEGSAQPNVNGGKLASLRLPILDVALQKRIAEFIRCVRLRQDGEKVDLPELPPPLAEQRRVVARIEELAEYIGEAQKLRHECDERRVALWVSHLESVFLSLSKGSQPVGCILERAKRVVILQSGVAYNPAGLTNQAKGIIAYPPISSADTKYQELYALAEGDLVYSKLKVWEGSLAIVDPEHSGRVVSGEFPTFVVDYAQVERDFLDLWLRRPSLWKWLGDQVRGIGGRKIRVNQETFLRAPFPLLERATQQVIADGLREFQRSTAKVKHLQSETSTELDTLLPAILDRAFKGEL